MKPVLPLAIALTFAAALGAVAQTPPAPAPAPPPPPPTYSMVSVFGAGRAIAANSGQPTPLRRAVADGDIRDWLPDDDIAVTTASADKRMNGSIRLDLAVTPEGAVNGCHNAQVYGPQALFDGLCDRVSERAKFHPAIDESGVPLPDVYSLYVSFNRSPSKPERIVQVRTPPPAPPPPGGQWPPTSDPRLVSVTGLDLVPGGPMDPAALGPIATGLVYSPENTAAPCKIVKPSGDPLFDAAACKAAAKGRYDFSAVPNAYQRRLQLHLVKVDGRALALVPVQKVPSRPAVTPRALAMIQQAMTGLPEGGAARLRLDVDVDPTGAIVGCAITATTGSDAGDVAVCTAVRRSGPFVPARDIFGRPFQARLFDWSPAGAAAATRP